MKAYLYDGLGTIVAANEVSDTDPPKHIDYLGRRYSWVGSCSRLDSEGVEQVGWDYALIDGSEGDPQGSAGSLDG